MDYEQVTGDVAEAIVRRAALADLLVAGRTPQKDEFEAPTTRLLGDLLFSCRTPVFIPGDEQSAGAGLRPGQYERFGPGQVCSLQLICTRHRPSCSPDEAPP